MAVLDHERTLTTAPPVAPSPIAAYLLELLERIGRVEDGDVASYIPELATADPTLFGICLSTVDGAVYEVGDTNVPFTIQSMSKPLTYGIALEQLGDAAVRSRVGVEPSGDAFNEISLAPGTGAPLNPMINAGAIACAALVGDGAADPFAAIVDVYSAYAGKRLEFDEAVYLSERATGHRNRAIVHLLRNFGVVAGDPEAAVDLYFRQCSLSVDCRDLAGIAATLANGGINPVTGERAVREDVVRSVLSVMTTCGMYDSAGEWLVSVGLPAKSGVSGGVLAVLPGRLGIGVYSPRLDESGNSVRGIAVCRELSRDLALHLITPGQRLAPAIRSSYTVAERGSKRVRHADELVAIAGAADRTAVFELQGEFGFTAAEAISRAVTERESPPELVVLDLRRMTRVDRGGIDFVTALASYLDVRLGRLALSHAELLESAAPSGASVFADLDGALEWCESELLLRLGAGRSVDAVSPDDHELLRELGPEELARLLPNLGLVSAPAGSVLIRRGDPATEIFLVTGGSLSVVAQLEDGREVRLSTVSAGMTFGEVAYVTGGSRTADVRADSEVECRTLSFATIEALAQSDPPLHGKLLRSLIRVVVSRLLAADAAVAELAR
jgi:glutaminase